MSGGIYRQKSAPPDRNGLAGRFFYLRPAQEVWEVNHKGGAPAQRIYSS